MSDSDPPPLTPARAAQRPPQEFVAATQQRLDMDLAPSGTPPPKYTAEDIRRSFARAGPRAQPQRLLPKAVETDEEDEDDDDDDDDDMPLATRRPIKTDIAPKTKSKVTAVSHKDNKNSDKVRKKPGPKPYASKPLAKNDLGAKLEVIRAIEKNWGKNFIKEYIPKCHRPLVKTSQGKRTGYRDYEANPMNWLPSVLKSMLMISNITKDKAFLRKAMNDIVRYRISHTGNRKPQLVTTDFDIIEDIHTRGWDVATSFEIRYKHLLLAQAKPDQPSSEDIDRIMYAGTDSDGDEEYESTESRLTKLGMPVKDDSEEEQPGSKKYIFTSPRYPPKLVADDAPKQRKTISKPEEPSPLKKEPRKRQASPSSSKAKKTSSESKDSNTSETPKKKPKVQEPHDQSNMQFPPQMQQMYGYGPYPFGGNPHLGNPFYPHPNMGDFPSQFPPYGYGGYPGYGQQPSYPRMGPPGHRGPQDQDPRGMENSAGRHRRQEMQGVHGMHGMRAMQEFNDRHRQAGQDTYPVDPPPNMGINPHYPFRDPYYSPYSTPAPQSAYMAEGDNAGRRVRAREQTNFGNRMDLDDDDDEEQFDRETRAALERRGREISIKREPGLYNNPISLDDNETHLNIRTYNQYVGDNNEEDPDAKVLRLQQELARAEERSKKAHARAAAEAAKRK